MNTSSEVFANHRRSAGKILLGLSLCAGLASCGTAGLMTSAKTDPRSKIADQVAALTQSTGPYPTFEGIPAMPTDIRPLRAWGEGAHQVEAMLAELERATAPGTWSLSGTERFSAQARSQIDMSPALAVSSAAESEAFARALRKRATPPPPPKR